MIPPTQESKIEHTTTPLNGLQVEAIQETIQQEMEVTDLKLAYAKLSPQVNYLVPTKLIKALLLHRKPFTQH